MCTQKLNYIYLAELSTLFELITAINQCLDCVSLICFTCMHRNRKILKKEPSESAFDLFLRDKRNLFYVVGGINSKTSITYLASTNTTIICEQTAVTRLQWQDTRAGFEIKSHKVDWILSSSRLTKVKGLESK